MKRFVLSALLFSACAACAFGTGACGDMSSAASTATPRLSPTDVALAQSLLDEAASLVMGIEYADDADDRYRVLDVLRRRAIDLASIDPDKALKAAREIADPRERSNALVGIVVALAETRPEQALEIARGIPSLWKWQPEFGPLREFLPRAYSGVYVGVGPSWALYVVFVPLARTAPAMAFNAARDSEDPAARLVLLTAVATLTAERHAALSRQAANAALHAARTMPNKPVNRAALRSAVAQLTLTPAHPEVTLAMSRLIADSAHRAPLITRLAGRVASADRKRGRPIAAEAVRTAAAIRTEPARGNALIEAVSAIGAFYPDVARAAVARIKSARARDQASAQVMRRAIDAFTNGESWGIAPDKAVNLALRMKDPASRDAGLHGVAVAFARTNPEQALKVVQRMKDKVMRDQAMGGIILAMAPRDPELALRLARNHVSRNHDQFVQYLVARLAPLHPDKAVEAARTISDGSRRALTLGELASKLADRDSVLSRSAAAQALALAQSPANTTNLGQLLSVVLEVGKTQPQLSAPAAAELLAAARKQSQQEKGPEFLAFIARALIRTHPEISQTAAAEAVAAATWQEPRRGHHDLVQVAQVLASSYPDKAAEAAHAIKDRERRAEVLGLVASCILHPRTPSSYDEPPQTVPW
ncbi:MAG TPA: hypothetical protein VM221_03430 [Armatimonadota bacterium]|nr:hypothetical protein [Armatimonadota bacterium]